MENGLDFPPQYFRYPSFNVVLFPIGEFSPNFDLKNMILIYLNKWFLMENGPNSPSFKEKNFKLPNIVWWILVAN
jgi:hypothetical protein